MPKSGTSKMTSAVIVSVYNEQKYLKSVLDTILESKVFDEIICVDDGSKDKSLDILKSYKDKIKIITWSKNKGKSYAMVAGIRESKSDIIVFCDADLLSITKDHFVGLVEPIRHNIADQVLAIREGDIKIFKNITGERAYRRKDLLPHLDRIEPIKFGIETYLNHAFSDVRTLWVTTKGLHQAGKSREVTIVTDMLQEGFEILAEIAKQKDISNKGVLKQIKKIKSKFNESLTKLERLLPTNGY